MNSVSCCLSQYVLKTEYSFAFCVGERALLCFSSDSLQLSPGLLCRGSSSRVYLWINARCCCLQNGAVAHICCANTAHCSFIEMFLLAWQRVATFRPGSGTFHWQRLHVPQLQSQTLSCYSQDIPKVSCVFRLLFWAVLFSSVRPASSLPMQGLSGTYSSPACPITFPVITNSSLESFSQWHLPLCYFQEDFLENFAQLV